MPKSPFFRPSQPERVVLKEQSISTPKGRNRRTRSVVVPTEGSVKEHKSGILGCAANMMTCIVGSGIVGLPYAMQQTGFVAGILLIVLTATLTEKSLRLLVETAKHLHKQSYETTAEVAFGTVGFRFVLINMAVMAYGAMVSYLMITRSAASMLWGIEDELQQQFVLVLVSMVIQLPLACMRDMADLEKMSAMAVAIDGTIVALIVFSAPWIGMQGLEQNTVLELVETDIVHTSTLFVGLGVLSFAFECQESAFLIAGSLEKPTVGRWAKVTKMTLTACLGLAMVCALTGYLGYGAATKGNILDNLDPGTTTSLLAHGMLGITMFATYPLASFVARHVCVVLLFEGNLAHEGGEDSSILNRADRRILLTVALYLAALASATIATDMGSVLALAGVIGGSSLAYIGPGMLYLAVHGGRFLELVDEFFMVPMDEHATTNGYREGQQLASETTILVARPQDDNDNQLPRGMDGCCKTMVWYLVGMPLWCYIADLGKTRVLAHANALATKNTLEHSRIGAVDHAGIEKLAKNVTAPSRTLHRPLSNPDLHQQGLVPPKVKTKLATTTKPKDVLPSPERDPQDQPPAGVDFFIAIFYVCFGCVALFAGLYSLSLE